MIYWLTENWYFVITGMVLVVMGGLVVADFLKLPRKEQIAKVKEWLLFAVTEAEKQMGSGTGQLKLRQVYDLFVQRFPIVAAAISFDTFSMWVDEALDSMREMLAGNAAVYGYVEGGNRHESESQPCRAGKLWRQAGQDTVHCCALYSE